MKTVFRIGDFSEMNQISIQTLRYYDQIGLLKPYWVDKESHYRYYHINQSALVDAIQYLQDLDFSLQEIREILSSSDEDLHFHQLLEERRQSLVDKRSELDKKIRELEHFQSGTLLHQAKRSKTSLEVLYLPERPIVTFDIEQNIYDMNQEEYELSLRYLKQEVAHLVTDDIHFSRVGSLMAQEKFCQQDWQSQQFFFLTEKPCNFSEHKAASLPAAYYAVTYASSFEDELKQLPLFFEELKAADYVISGPYICEVIHEHPVLDKNERHMFIRMQITVAVKS